MSDDRTSARVLRPLELLRVLVEGEVEFVVIGGFSLAAHGVQRATKDIDITPAGDFANLTRLHQVLQSIGAEPIESEDFRPEELPVTFGPEGLAQGGNWFLATELGRIDLMQYVEGVESYDVLRRGAVSRDLPGVGKVWFAGRYDLIAMKEAAGRPIDFIDVEALKGRNP